MSENRENVRRLYRRKIQDEKKAVSPVVATLLLILIAVAAAAALWVFVNQFQTSTQNSAGSPSAQAQITIGGSTSVFPFDNYAAQEYMANNSGVTISNNQGGTGAGMLAVCHGSVDIGAASSLQTVSNLESADGCPTTVVINTVAYDAVDVITQVANPHGLISIGADTLLSIYYMQSTSVPTVPGNGAAGLEMNGGALPAGLTAVSAGGTGLAWENIPACVSGASCAGLTETAGAAFGVAALCPSATLGPDLCYSGSGTVSSPCGWNVCAGGATAALQTASIQTVARSDTSGTTQTFTAKLLDISGSSVDTSYSAVQNGFTGCGSDGQLGSCGISSTSLQSGNPAVISAVAANANAIGYASDGLARASGSGVTCQGVATAACGIGFEAIQQGGAVQPSLSSSGTIANAIKGAGTATSQYAGWRPFEWVTTNTPTGITAEFLTWVLDPANNQAVAGDAAEISIYSI